MKRFMHLSPANLSLLKTAQVFPQGLELFTFRPARWPWGSPKREVSIQRADAREENPVRVALYCRSDRDGEATTSVQRERLLELVETWSKEQPRPRKVVRIYEDERFSDASLSRPGLFLLREAARRGEFDVVITLGLGRLARSPSHLLTLGRELFDRKVQAYSLQKGESGAVEPKNLFPNIETAIAVLRPARIHAPAPRSAAGE